MPAKPWATAGLQRIKRETLRTQSLALSPARLEVKAVAVVAVKVEDKAADKAAAVKAVDKAAGKAAVARAEDKAAVKAVDKAEVAAEDEDAPDNSDENTTPEPLNP